MSKLPKFLCVGAQKAGTTWLYQVLSNHPEVFLPRIKELLHFIDIPKGEADDWRHRMVLEATVMACNQYIHHERTTLRPGFAQYILSFGAQDRFTDQWYERIYSAAPVGAVSGDVTPEYMMMGTAGIARVKALLGDVKIILLVRDPIERLWSQVRMISKESGLNPKEAYWDISRRHGCKKNSDYAKFIPIWVENTRPENLGIFNFHALARNAGSFYDDILEFLDLAPHASGHAEQIIHQGMSSEVSEDILEDMQNLLSPQISYLNRTFGADWREGESRLTPITLGASN